MEKEHFYRDARRDLAGPLDGVTVLEMTTTWAGPMAGCLLGDYGAAIVKVEHPAGEVARRLVPMIPGSNGLAVPHETVNRNKRSVTVDLDTADGREILLRLARDVDIVIENFRPGTLAGWGVGYDDVRAVNPDVVYLSVSGFGQFGPNAERPAYDPLAQHYCGWASLNGEAAGAPVKAPTFLGDDLSGLHGALAVLAALRHRDRTGEGQHVDVCLVDSLFYQSNGHLTCGALDIPIPRTGNQFTLAAPVNMYTCTDGRVFAGVLLDAHWQKLAAVLGRPELGNDVRYASIPARIAHRDELDALLAAWCAERATAEVVKALNEAWIPVTRTNTFAEAAREPQVAARDMLQPTRLCDGTVVPLTGPSAKFSRTPTAIRSAAEPLGASTREVLTAVGYSEERIAQLRNEGVI